MANLEQLISRYLDGELNALEQTELCRLLVDSTEARALFREMTSVAHAARRMPLLYRPERGLEEMLFQRLRREGLYMDKGVVEHPGKRSRWRSIATAMQQRGALVGAPLVVALIGLFAWFGGGAPSPPPVADLRASKVPALSLDRGDYMAPSPVAVAPRRAEKMNAPPSRRLPRRSIHGGSLATPRDRDIPELNRAPDLLSVDRSMPDSADDSRLLDPGSMALRAVDTLGGPFAPERPALAVAETPRREKVPSIFPQSDPAGIGGVDWLASLRGGLAAVNGIEETMVREFDVKVGIEMKGGHQISLIGGLASSISETRSEHISGILVGSTINDDGVGAGDPGARHVGPSTKMEKGMVLQRNVQSEPWFGMSYNYSLPVIGGLSVEPGMKLGASASTWRAGVEIPVRYKVSEKISLECAMSGVRILPRREQADSPRLTGIIDLDAKTTYRAFTTYGVQIGVRLDFGR